MNPTTRAEKLFDRAKAAGLVNPVTDEGAPTVAMVAGAIIDAQGDADMQKCGDAWQEIIALQDVLSTLNARVHSGYDFNADPDGMTKRISDANDRVNRYFESEGGRPLWPTRRAS